jgi:glycolate oxidase iron-sulfur subunit
MSNQERDLLKQINEIAGQCDRCGTCLPVCPLFGVKDVEASSARGKNNIARALVQGGLDTTPDVLAAVNFCLLCRACVDNCPSKVKTDEAMIAVRQHFADKAGGAGAKYTMIGGMLKHRRMVKLAAGAFSMMRKVGAHRLVPSGMVPDEYTREKYLAAFAGPAALGTPAPRADVPVTVHSRVAYFYGCGMRMMFPEAAAETLAIIRSQGEPMLVDNGCCGLPHLAHGLREDFLALAKENIRLYKEADIIVCDCASCSGTLKHVAAYFADDPAWKERADAFSRKVMDLTEYLTKIGYQPRQRMDVTMTFHEPCHLGRGQGIKKQPRELLKAAGNYVEMAGADTCCGGAGSFHMDYPDISSAVLDKKRANIEKTGAQIVVTECPVCLVQMTKAAEKSGGKFRAMHISQVI